jgi:hypothetical protein
MGLARLFPRRHSAGEGDGRADGRKMQLWGSYGRACAPDFIAEDFLNRRKEYEWARGLLRDMKTGDWALFEITR